MRRAGLSDRSSSGSSPIGRTMILVSSDAALEDLLQYLDTHGNHSYPESKIRLLEIATKWLRAALYVAYDCPSDAISIELNTGYERRSENGPHCAPTGVAETPSGDVRRPSSAWRGVARHRGQPRSATHVYRRAYSRAPMSAAGCSGHRLQHHYCLPKASAPCGDCSAGRDRSGHRAHSDLRKDLRLLTRATAPAG